MKNIFLIASAAIVLFACTNKAAMKPIDLSNLDTTANPTVDFYQYACGGWMINNPLPDDKSRYGSFDQLGETNRDQVKALIEKLGKTKNKKGTNAYKIGVLYAAGMNMESLNKEGYQPIAADIERIKTIKNVEDFWKVLNEMQVEGASPLFGIFGEADATNSKMNIAWLVQTGLGMGDRDYYLEQDEHSQSLREAYLKMIISFLTLSNFSENDAAAMANSELNFETELAKIMMSRLEMRDPIKTFNKLKISELQKLCPAVDWNQYFSNLKLNIEELNVMTLDYFKNLSALLAKTDIETLKTYLIFEVINGAAGSLSQAFVDANFAYYGTALSGQEVQEERWKTITNVVSGVLGEAIGEEYVKIYFPEESKTRMLELVKNIQTTLGERIGKLDWMSDETKAKAIDKLNTIYIKIGYPDKWRDYSALNIEEGDSYYSILRKATKFNQDYTFSKINKEVDPNEWLMTPQTVNAYYNPTTNEICFPAGILQPPFFFKDGDDAVNYGAIGVVIAHEITHGFDDQGRLYDKEGNLNDWWTAEDGAKFTAKAQVLVDWYNKIEVAPGVFANGGLSLGENIADFGGLTISYNAFQKTEQYSKGEKIDDFTPTQRFYLAYSTVWASNIRDKEILRRTKEDVHSLGKWRVNGQLSHQAAFLEAFGVKEGDPMWLAPENRANIW